MKPKKPYYRLKTQVKIREIIRQPWKLPMAAQNLAAISIQRVIRGYLTRKHLREPAKPPPKKKISPAQSLARKYQASKYYSKADYDGQLKVFCAAKIAATFRMKRVRSLYILHRYAMYHVAAIQIQWAWRVFLRKKKGPPTIQSAAIKVQRAWRSYTNSKIFKYYKELIHFKQKGDPRELLKTINPLEASLIDKASNLQIRFRLGGNKFPPLIYYKIFVVAGVCDVNSFAPRDYTEVRKISKKTTVNMTFESEEVKKATEGWYQRSDNNGWRPITDNVLAPFDSVESATAKKVKTYHFDKKKRGEITAAERRRRKLKWLKKLYFDAKRSDDVEAEKTRMLEGGLSTQLPAEPEENPFSNPELEHMPEPEFEAYVDDLLEWSETLDYDKYMENWSQIATSAPSSLKVE